ncbi:hypothetical protein BKA70DRAFT_548622 [Coprinopsis sp. MPI-PUGE-AT-0042]|nr:hypothetical protein BKA70DRAFT_548622 [Coprinopsis sp. MPI-PUGE-AT-0042]
MADQREQEVNTFGNLLAASDFGGAILGGALLAIQWLVVLSGLSIFFSTPREKRRGRLRFVLIGCLILATSTIDVVLDIWRAFRVSFTGGPSGRAYLEAGSEIWLQNSKWLMVGDIMLCITIAAGDLLMLWRCFALWRNRLWVMIVPTLACIGAIVCNPIYVASNAIEGGGGLDASKAIIAATCLSVGMNIIVTFLILLRLVMASVALSKAFPDHQRPALYTHVAAVIIESAAPLTIFGIGFIICTALTTWAPPDSVLELAKRFVAGDVFSWLYYSFCALSPQLIIFRVATGRSWQGAGDSNEGAATFSQPLQFAQHVEEMKGTTSTETV